MFSTQSRRNMRTSDIFLSDFSTSVANTYRVKLYLFSINSHVAYVPSIFDYYLLAKPSPSPDVVVSTPETIFRKKLIYMTTIEGSFKVYSKHVAEEY